MTDFGKTLKLEENIEGQDLIFNADNRLLMVDNTDKVKQDITILFKTQVGEDMFHTEFGFDFLSIINSSREEMVKLMVTQALLRFKYLSYIESVTIDQWDYEGRRVYVTVRAGIEALPVAVTFEVI